MKRRELLVRPLLCRAEAPVVGSADDPTPREEATAAWRRDDVWRTGRTDASVAPEAPMVGWRRELEWWTGCVGSRPPPEAVFEGWRRADWWGTGHVEGPTPAEEVTVAFFWPAEDRPTERSERPTPCEEAVGS